MQSRKLLNGILLFMAIFGLMMPLQGQLSGTYTVNPNGTGDYTTLQAAADDLAQKGVNGAVTINIASGTYNTQWVIDSIPGTSAANTVTFQSQAQDTAAVDIVFNNGNASGQYVVMLRNVQHVTLRYLTIRNNADDRFNTVLLAGSCAHVRLAHNALYGDRPDLDGGNAVVKTDIYLDTVIFKVSYPEGPFFFDHNSLYRAAQGFQIAGNMINLTKNVNVTNNYVHAKTGLIAIAVDSIYVGGNVMDGELYEGSGVSMGFTEKALIENNRLYGFDEGVGATSGFQNAPVRIYNNVIAVQGERALTLSVPAEVIHNSVLNNDPSSEGYLYSSGFATNDTSVTLLNNIFCNYAEGGIVLGGRELIDSSDYNAYFTVQDTFWQNFFTVGAKNLSAWQDSTGQDAHSIFTDPFFDTDSTLVPAAGVLRGAGTYIPFLPTDINGYPRDPNNVTIGAIEITTTPNLQPTALSATPDTVITGNGMQISYQGNNTGTAGVNGQWIDGVYLCTSPQLADSVLRLNRVQRNQFLPPGGSYNTSFSGGIPATLSGGTYYVMVYLNENKGVFEDGNDNILASSPVTIIPNDRPNLVVTSVTAPPAIQSGQVAHIEWTIKNTGTVPTTAVWYDYIYWHPDSAYFVNPAQFNPDSLLKFVVEAPTGLLPGETYTQSKDYRLPLQMSGVYYAVVMTDGGQQILEEIEGTPDNVGMDRVNVSQLPLADLEVTSVSVPATVFSGEKLYFSYTVKNTGSAAMALDKRWDLLVLSRDSVPDEDTWQINVRDKDPRHWKLLQPLEEHIVQDSFQMPYCKAGKFFVHVYTNYYEHVPEITNDNNAGSAGPVEVVLKPNPDMVITKVDISSSQPTTEQSLIIEYTLKNTGFDSVVVPRFYSEVIYMHDGATWDSLTAVRTGFNNYISPYTLQIGEDTTVRTSFTIPNDQFGQQYISVYTDISNKVCELPFEDNNVGTSQVVNVALAPQKDLLTDQVTFPASLTAGDQATLQYQWRNDGPGGFTTSTEDSIFLVPAGAVPTEKHFIKTIQQDQGLSGNGSKMITESLFIPLMTPPGTYELVIRTDAEDRIYEHQAEANNDTRTAPFSVQRDPNRLPDLSVSNIMVSGQAFSGQTLSLAYQVDNLTTRQTLSSAWKDRILLLYPDSSVVAYTTRYRNFPLDGKDAYQVQVDFKLPHGIEGPFLLQVVADYEGNVLEYNNSNNKYTIQLPVTLSPWPDLHVAAINAPDTLIYGQPNTVPYDLHNGGQAPADTPWTDRLFLSTDKFLDPFDIRIYNGTPAVTSLPNGSTYTEQRSFRFSNAPAGYYYLIASTDVHDQQYEHTDEGNNVTASTGQVYVHKPLPSDLSPLADSICLVRPGYVTYTLRNAGPNPAKGSWSDVLFLSDDKVWDPTDPLLGEVEWVDTTFIAPGQIKHAYWSGNMPFVKPGYYYVLVRADAYNLIPETDLSNNLQSSIDSFYLDPVTPLTPNVAYDTSYPKFGWRSHYYSVPVQAGQGILMQMDAHTPSTAVELFYRKGALPGRGGPFDARGSNAFEASQKLLMASDTTGYTGYGLAHLDFSIRDSVPYTIIAETRTFSLESVTPDHGGNKGIITLDIRGFDFTDSMAVSLVGSQDTAEAHHVFPINTLETRAHVDLNEVVPGVYDVVLKRLDRGDETVLSQAFTVEDTSYHAFYLEVMAPDIALINQPVTVTVTAGNLGNINDYDVMVAIPIYRHGFHNDGFKVKYMGDGISNTMPEEARALHPFDSTALIKYDQGYLFLAWYAILPSQGRTNFTFEITGTMADTTHISPRFFRNPVSDIHFTGDTADIKNTFFMRQLAAILTPDDPAGAGFRNGNCNTDPEQLEGIIYAGIRQHAEYTLGGLPTTRSAAAATILQAGLKNTFNPEASPEVKEVADNLMEGWKGTDSYVQTLKPGSNSYYEYLIRNLDKCLDINQLKEEVQYGCLRMLSRVSGTNKKHIYTYECPPDGPPPPNDGGGGPVDDFIDWVKSLDPNEIVGPAGTGAPRYVEVNDRLPYTIYFENLATTGAPARFVSIENPLPDGFDIRQFRLGEVGWGDTIIQLPNAAFYTGSVQLGPKYFNHRVDIVAGIDVVNRKAFWRFTTIDPATGAQPTNPRAGFLPPNDSTGIGQGFVRYNIMPMDTLKAGHKLDNQAEIQFDQEKVLATNVWTNTITGYGLQSSMLPRPAFTDSVTFKVQWEVFYPDSFAVNADRVEVYVAEGDTGSYTLWQISENGAAGYFTGERGQTYHFYSLAIGENGVPEYKTKDAEISVTIDSLTSVDPLPGEQASIAWQLYPNPYQDHLSATLRVDQPAKVQLVAYDLSGRILEVLYQGNLNAGTHRLKLPKALQLPNGLLMVELRIDGYRTAKRLMHF